MSHGYEVERRLGGAPPRPNWSLVARIAGVALFDLGFAIFARSLLREGAPLPAGFVIATAVIISVIFFVKRLYPLRWIAPGLTLMLLFVVYPVVNTVHTAFTNAGGGHLLTKRQALDQLESRTYTPASAAYVLLDGVPRGRRDVSPLPLARFEARDRCGRRCARLTARHGPGDGARRDRRLHAFDADRRGALPDRAAGRGLRDRARAPASRSSRSTRPQSSDSATRTTRRPTRSPTARRTSCTTTGTGHSSPTSASRCRRGSPPAAG